MAFYKKEEEKKEEKPKEKIEEKLGVKGAIRDLVYDGSSYLTAVLFLTAGPLRCSPNNHLETTNAQRKRYH